MKHFALEAEDIFGDVTTHQKTFQRLLPQLKLAQVDSIHCFPFLHEISDVLRGFTSTFPEEKIIYRRKDIFMCWGVGPKVDLWSHANSGHAT